jgi:hypothetical protein
MLCSCNEYVLQYSNSAYNEWTSKPKFVQNHTKKNAFLKYGTPNRSTSFHAFCFYFRNLIIKDPQQTIRTGRNLNSEAKFKTK